MTWQVELISVRGWTTVDSPASLASIVAAATRLNAKGRGTNVITCPRGIGQTGILAALTGLIRRMEAPDGALDDSELVVDHVLGLNEQREDMASRKKVLPSISLFQ